MAWPTLDELREAIGSTGAELPAARETILSRALEAAIELVLVDTIEVLEEEEPTAAQAAAALFLAVKVTKAPDAPFGVAAVFDTGGLYVAARDPSYQRLLKGLRTDWGVA
jgi:hypothetical protein